MALDRALFAQPICALDRRMESDGQAANPKPLLGLLGQEGWTGSSAGWAKAASRGRCRASWAGVGSAAVFIPFYLFSVIFIHFYSKVQKKKVKEMFLKKFMFFIHVFPLRK